MLSWQRNLFTNFALQKSRLEEIIPDKRKEVAEFRKEYGNAKIGEVTVGMVNALVSFFI